MTERYEKALAFATLKHEGQTRKEGIPYITHPMAVAQMLAQQGYNEEYQLAGLFHDLLEDTDANEAEIIALAGQNVLEAVKLVTKEKGYNMADYMAKILENPMAKAVKIADRLHNLRCAVNANEAFRRRYIMESIEWYVSLSDDIKTAVIDLNNILEIPFTEEELWQRKMKDL